MMGHWDPFSYLILAWKIFIIKQIKKPRGGGQNTDPMDYPDGLPKWTALKWTNS